MNSGKYIFRQITEFINRYEFDKYVERYKGDLGVRDLDCWNLLLQLIFGQLTSRNSLRNICLCLEKHSKKLYHLGIKQFVNVSSLSRAIEKRDWRIFADYGQYLIRKVQPLYTNESIRNVHILNDVYALDSTSISVSINLLSWAFGKYSRGAVKIHTLLDLRGNIPSYILVTDGKYHDSNILDEIIPVSNDIYIMDKAYLDLIALYKIHSFGAFFVTRTKKNTKYQLIESNFNIDETTGLRYDRTIIMSGAKSKELYPEKIRVIGYYDEKKDELFEFLTNNFDITALEIANLYKNRWQIEVFFKWIKQNLTIKHLWGHSENAVKIHIWIAIITYLLIAYIKKILDSKLSTYDIIQILGLSVFDKSSIKELIANDIDNQYFNEQLNLFDF
jgi:transposase DDE domain